jgi:uncharacterized protein YjbI with pentapeptide repeats
VGESYFSTFLKGKIDLSPKSIEQLGNHEETIRIGGIYALERIANDSPRDAWTIMEVLSSFIRGKQDIKGQDTSQPSPIRTDAQAALTVIKRRSIELEDSSKYLDLSFTNLHEANLVDGNFDRIKLNNSILTQADSNANLNNANLSNAHLNDTNLIQANLTNANLSSTDLNEANLNKANLSDAILDGAQLINASLGNTNLTSAILIGANIRGATLSKTNLSKTDLSGADLYQTNLSDANINKTDFRKTKNLTIAQIKQTKNWELGIYDNEIDRLLKPPAIVS